MAQFLRPASDVDAGEFLPSTGSDLYAMLDETSPDDGDYVFATGNGSFRVALSAGTDPASSSGHIARYRAKGNGVADLRVTAFDVSGDPDIQVGQWVESAVPASWTPYAHTLAGGEADSIEDYGALEYLFEVGDFTAPTLSSPQDGTPTADGTTGPGVSTNEANGTLYWAVLTNGGSCTDAQLKAGSGGNIVAGKAGNQAVSGTGAQVTADITGLSASTDYELVWLHRDAAGNDSAQATVGLTTAAGGGDVAFDAISSNTIFDCDQTSQAPTITVGSGANRVLLCRVVYFSATQTVSGVSSSVDGAFTQISGALQTATSDGATYGIDWWILKNPTAGAHTVTATMSGEASALCAVAISYENVNQTTSNGAVAKTGWDQNSPTTYDHVIDSAAGDMAVSGLLLFAGNAGMLSVTAGTERAELAEACYWGSACTGGDLLASGATTTIGYGIASGGNDSGGVSGFALKKA